MSDLTRPETIELSEAALDRYHKKEDRKSNSAARKDPEVSIFEAIQSNRESYMAMKIEGQSVHEIIRGL